MNLLFVIDDYTSVEPAPVVRAMADIVLDALNNPHKSRPEGEILLGVVTQQHVLFPCSQFLWINTFGQVLGAGY